MSDVTIREGRGPEEHALYAGFIDALQAYEHAMEPDRRIDPRAGADYLPVLLTRVKEHDGKIFVAEIDGRPVGWAVFHCDDGANYLVPEERRSGLVAELYLEEAARGRGLGPGPDRSLRRGRPRPWAQAAADRRAQRQHAGPHGL